MSDLDRAFAFVERADMFGARREPFGWGAAVFHPGLPLRHDSNYLRIDRLPRDVGAADLAREAERIQGTAGLAYRSVLFRHAPDGERLAPGLAALGWQVFRGVVMALRRPPAAEPAASPVVRVRLEDLRAAREENLRVHPWATPAVARELAGARALSPVPVVHYAVREDGRPVAWLDVLQDGTTAQLEELATVESHRRRGHARALLARAIRDAIGGGVTFVFLCADAADWPRDFYRRIGFETIGTYVKCSRGGP